MPPDASYSNGVCPFLVHLLFQDVRKHVLVHANALRVIWYWPVCTVAAELWQAQLPQGVQAQERLLTCDHGQRKIFPVD
jgi:hypothetical protein